MNVIGIAIPASLFFKTGLDVPSDKAEVLLDVAGRIPLPSASIAARAASHPDQWRQEACIAAINCALDLPCRSCGPRRLTWITAWTALRSMRGVGSSSPRSGASTPRCQFSAGSRQRWGWLIASLPTVQHDVPCPARTRPGGLRTSSSERPATRRPSTVKEMFMAICPGCRAFASPADLKGSAFKNACQCCRSVEPEQKQASVMDVRIGLQNPALHVAGILQRRFAGGSSGSPSRASGSGGGGCMQPRQSLRRSASAPARCPSGRRRLRPCPEFRKQFLGRAMQHHAVLRAWRKSVGQPV